MLQFFSILFCMIFQIFVFKTIKNVEEKMQNKENDYLTSHKVVNVLHD